ncbi:transmembrane protein, putative [Bodo saltans]|uniref:Transmembrane protein, putative n=1 Tax=Bodo saltans TaxID=75058 RepID=A0A0S4INR5_BODSA|nr:transmembrane protein, putative [Bodo saltans]|eukprot:CUF72642.1 transmembrane protein, putative [Bodo saltans]
MEFNAFSFLLPFASPLDDTAYFDGCYQYLDSDYHATHFPYLDCLACNNNVPYVNTSSLNSKPQNKTFYLTASSIVGLVALFLAMGYFNLATRALIYGALLSFGVYTEITPIFFDSKRKMLILFVIAVYSAIGAYMSVASAQTLEVILETLTIGNSATGSCYQDVSGIASNEAVHASFSANNPAVTHLDASTSSVKSAILTYATAIFVYVPILLSFYGVLAHPYNSFDAGELFEGVEDTADGSDTSGNILRKNNSVASTTTNGEKTIAKVIQENIRFRIREEALHAAVVKVHKRWSEPRKASLTWLESNPVFFLVHWASSNSAEDIALVEEVVKLAMESEAVSESV